MNFPKLKFPAAAPDAPADFVAAARAKGIEFAHTPHEISAYNFGSRFAHKHLERGLTASETRAIMQAANRGGEYSLECKGGRVAVSGQPKRWFRRAG